MNINDPFGRRAQKQERDYASLRQTLKTAGVKTATDVQRCERNIKRNAAVMVALSVFSVVLAALLYRPVLGLVIVLAATVVLWIIVNLVRVRGYLRRYLAEEVEGEASGIQEGG